MHRWLPLAMLLLAIPGQAGDLSLVFSTSREDALQVRSYPVGLMDVDSAAQLVRRLLSPEGLVVEDRAHRRLLVHDRPDVHARIQAALAAIELPASNVRIIVTHDYETADR